MARPSLVLGITALGLVATAVTAQESSAFRFSGFGSLGATRSSEDKADFLTNFAMPDGPGFTRNTDVKGDSRLGLQGDLRLGEHFSAVAQVISEHRYDGTFKPYLNIATLKLQALPGLAFRVGRIPYSAYLISDFQKVGYAQPWVRPPVEVYQFNPLTSVDGADLTWQANAGAVAFSGQFLGGSIKAKIAPSSIGVKQYAALGQEVPEAEWTSKQMYTASLAANWGSNTLRAFYGSMKGTYDDPGYDQPYSVTFLANNSPFSTLRADLILNPYFNPAQPPGPTNPLMIPNPYKNVALADKLQIKDKKVTYLSAAYSYDPGNWFLMIEQSWKGGDADTMLSDFQAGYATLGARLGNWTPYATYAWKRTTGSTSDVNPIGNAVLRASNHGQSTVSGGLRWDFYKNLAFKIQYDSVKNEDLSAGALTNTHPELGFKPGQRYSLTTAAIDFVF